MNKSLPWVVALSALLLTGCPHNDYTVELTPRGGVIERKLIFYREDGNDTNGVPKYQAFPQEELEAIQRMYPEQGRTSEGERHVVKAEFGSVMPNDVGSSGHYTNLVTSLGAAGFYAERFRGNDDLAALAQKRLQAADELADMAVGWSRMELGRETNYDRLQHFLDGEFRQDLKNLSLYFWQGENASAVRTNAGEEFMVRLGQYLVERGYFNLEEMPTLFGKATWGDQHWVDWLQRQVARRMGVSDSERVPKSLDFLSDDDATKASFDRYAAGTEQYRLLLKKWEDQKASNSDQHKPEASEITAEAIETVLQFHLFEDPDDHLTVSLALPCAPGHTNGRWDEARRQVLWASNVEQRTNAARIPTFCYANWNQPDEPFQKLHLGKVLLRGDELMQYCLWRTALDADQGRAWDALLASLSPGEGLSEKLAAFRFVGEPKQAGTNAQDHAVGPSQFARDLLCGLLKGK